MFKVSAVKFTDIDLARDLAGVTSGKDDVKMSQLVAYRSEHSPIRGIVFVVDMLDIPSFVSVHFVRHKVGVEHYVKTNRDDRGGDLEANRWTPVRHKMLINAQGLMDMAQVRLCNKAHGQTRSVMQDIRRAVSVADPILAMFMVPKCVYRNGLCGEPMPCGMIDYNMVTYGKDYFGMFNQQSAIWRSYLPALIDRRILE